MEFKINLKGDMISNYCKIWAELLKNYFKEFLDYSNT